MSDSSIKSAHIDMILSTTAESCDNNSDIVKELIETSRSIINDAEKSAVDLDKILSTNYPRDTYRRVLIDPIEVVISCKGMEVHVDSQILQIDRSVYIENRFQELIPSLSEKPTKIRLRFGTNLLVWKQDNTIYGKINQSGGKKKNKTKNAYDWLPNVSSSIFSVENQKRIHFLPIDAINVPLGIVKYHNKFYYAIKESNVTNNDNDHNENEVTDVEMHDWFTSVDTIKVTKSYSSNMAKRYKLRPIEEM